MSMHTRWLAILISLLGGLTTSSNAMAAENIPTDKQITQIRSFTSYAHIDFETSHPNSLGCSSSVADRRVAIDWRSKPDRKVMFATAMLAYATNKSVGFSINGCHGSGVPKAIRLSVTD